MKEIRAANDLMDIAEFCWLSGVGKRSFLPDGTMKMIASAHPFRISILDRLLRPGVYFIPVQFKAYEIRTQHNLTGVSIKVFGMHKKLQDKVNNSISGIYPLDVESAIRSSLLHFCSHGDLEGTTRIWTLFLLNGYSKTYESEELREWVNCIMDDYGDVRIAEIAKRNNVSRQLLHRTFKRNTGIAPKQLAAIWRMNRFLITPQTQKSFTYSAHEAGYYDQAHSIHEVRRFTGLSPKEALGSDVLAHSFRHISARLSNGYAPPI